MMPIGSWKTALAEIDVDRIASQIHLLGDIGRQPTGGVTRLAFSDEDRAARQLLMRFMEEAGLQVRRDPVGNLIGTLPGRNPNAPAVMAGSHIDTVVNGGRLDGVLGVLSTVECARLIHRHYHCNSTIEVVCFVMEESSRFGAGYGFGSQVMAAHFVPDEHLLARDASGLTLATAVQKLKHEETGEPVELADEAVCLSRTRRDILASGRDLSHIGAFVELHIEQGPVLESTGNQIGIVTSIAAPTRLKVIFTGEQGHSGTTPMNYRRDALPAAAEAILAVERIAMQNVEKGVIGTVGTIQVFPGVLNVIPGQAEVGIDIRGLSAEAKTATIHALLQEIRRIGARRSIDVDVIRVSDERPMPLSEGVVNTIRHVCSALNIKAMAMPSGAGHDAAHMASRTAAGMIFVPSVGGVSHEPRERTELEDIRRGTQVLLATLLELAYRGE